MAADRDNAVAAPLINHLSFQTTGSMLKEVERLSVEHGQTVAVSIVLDALLMSAASLLMTAINNRMVRVTMPYQVVLHQRLDDLIMHPTRVHSQRPDGSFDPSGQAIN